MPPSEQLMVVGEVNGAMRGIALMTSIASPVIPLLV